MKKQIGLMTLSLMLVSPALAGGAGAPVKAPPKTCKSVAQIVAGDPQFSTLETAIQAAGLTSTLSGKGSYTVFAPTNAAFAKIPSDQLAAVLNDPQALKGVILYHVVGEKATTQQIRSVSGGTTLQGNSIAVSVKGNKLMINNATVIKADILACNGIVDVIDTVLMPPANAGRAAPASAPQAPSMVIPVLPLSGATSVRTTSSAPMTTAPVAPVASAAATDTSMATATATTTTDTVDTDTAATAIADADTTVSEAVSTDTAATTTTADTTVVADASNLTVYDVIAGDNRFSTLRDLLSDADLSASLISGEYTIFAPTDTAFASIPEAKLAAIRSDPAALKALLGYHVINRKVTQQDLQNSGQLVTLQGSKLNLGTNALGTALTASNGVIYPIDKVLMPADFKVASVAVVKADTSATPTNITAYVISDSRFSTLRGLLSTADLADTLTTGDYTVFAPTNEAFAKMDATKLAEISKDKTKLKALLLAHVVAGQPDKAALTAAPLKTLDGGTLTVVQNGTGLKVGDAASDGAVVSTGNGHIYVIDNVIVPANLK